MSDRMQQALYHHVHGAIHSAGDALAETVEATGQKMAAVPLEAVLGPVALVMFYDGMRFAQEHPAASRAYVAHMFAEAGLQATDDDREAFQALEAAWRPLQ